MTITAIQNQITVINHIKTADFEGFDFQTKTSFIVSEENEVDVSYFRFEKHSDGKTYINVASDDNYFIYEEAEFLFEIEEIEKECFRQYALGNIPEHTEQYLKFLEEEGTRYL